MTFGTEHLNLLYKTGTDAAQKCATLAVESAERVFRLQMDSMEQLWAMGSKRWSETLSSIDPSRPAAEWPALIESSTQGTMDMARACYKTGTQFQAELARIIEEQVPAMNNGLIQSIEEFTRAVTVANQRATQERAAVAREGERAAERRTQKLAA